MKIKFIKAVASGNDFVIIDVRQNRVSKEGLEYPDFARTVCRRKYSVGADGLLVLEDALPGAKKADFKMRIFNPDGSEVSMCGNGIRCSALYASTLPGATHSMTIETDAGTIGAEIARSGIRIRMTDPVDVKTDQRVGVGTNIINVHVINTGVLHAVHFVENIDNYPVKEMGEKLRYHKIFVPDGTNADFVKIIDENTISIRTYERGVEDETDACGTGAVASAIMSHLIEDVKQPVSVITKSKDVVKVYFKKENDMFSDVFLEGEARILFSGTMDR